MTEENLTNFHITFDEVDKNRELVKKHEYFLRMEQCPLMEFFLTSGYLPISTGRIENYIAIRQVYPKPENFTGIQRIYAQALLERQLGQEREISERNARERKQ